MILLIFNIFIETLTILIFIRVLVSWVAPNADNFFINIVNDITEPILSPLRSFLVFGNIDFSPIAAILALGLVQRIIHMIL